MKSRKKNSIYDSVARVCDVRYIVLNQHRYLEFLNQLASQSHSRNACRLFREINSWLITGQRLCGFDGWKWLSWRPMFEYRMSWCSNVQMLNVQHRRWVVRLEQDAGGHVKPWKISAAACWGASKSWHFWHISHTSLPLPTPSTCANLNASSYINQQLRRPHYGILSWSSKCLKLL